MSSPSPLSASPAARAAGRCTGPSPGRPRVRRIVTGGDLAVVEAAVDYGDGVDWSAVFIYELRDGKIARATAYWAQPFEAADSRAEWVQRMDG